MIEKEADTVTQEETIAAIATAPGHGGVGIIRVSGSLSRRIAHALFQPSSAGFTEFVPWKLHHGRIIDPREAGPSNVLDEALVVYMPGPRSFTGEDIVEMHCHGSPAVLEAVMRAILAQGARQAARGEFTRRAFMHGRMDLTQAEAVAELIHSQSIEGARLAQAKLSGLLGTRIRDLRGRIDKLRMLLITAVDFPDEEADILPESALRAGVEGVMASMRALLASYARNRIWQDGATVALAGNVNAGKSSLMNALLGRERALVSDVPGTTRDFLEERIMLDGLPARIIDTAGLRQTADPVEVAGLHVGMEKIDNADLVLLVVDVLAEEGKRMPACASFPELFACLEAAGQGWLSRLCERGKVLGVVNKTDLLPQKWALGRACMDWIPVSARTGEGLEELAACIRKKLLDALPGEKDEIALNLRQSQALERACLELEAMLSDMEQAVPYDLLGIRLELAAGILDEVTGAATSTDILDDIFSSFCIGK